MSKTTVGSPVESCDRLWLVFTACPKECGNAKTIKINARLRDGYELIAAIGQVTHLELV